MPRPRRLGLCTYIKRKKVSPVLVIFFFLKRMTCCLYYYFFKKIKPIFGFINLFFNILYPKTLNKYFKNYIKSICNLKHSLVGQKSQN